ncbi:spore germination protein [Bacillus sp. F19]|nr:spore germination protein [Bacillus sp. F19]
MEKNHKISARQFAILVILFTIGTTILVIPGSLAQVVEQDAWLAAVFGTARGTVRKMRIYNAKAVFLTLPLSSQ